MKHYFLILWSLFIFNGFLFCQSDSIIETSAPENITYSDTKAKEISIDLSNPKEIELTLKKIHTFKYLESVILQGETDESTLNKILYRLSVLKNLTSITLRDNELKKIPKNIAGIKTLRTFNVEGNSTLDYNDLFNILSQLPISELNLIDNDLKENPTNISEIKSLQKIKITGNNQLNYEDLVKVLTKLPSLVGLAIPVNYLTELPKNITDLKSLQVLDVSNNILTELPDGVSSLKAINNLAIQGNLLLNPAKDLEKLKDNDIRFLSLDKEVSGGDIEQIKKMFPNAEINFPLEIKDDDDENQQEINLQAPTTSNYKGELKTQKELKIISGAYLLYPSLFQGRLYNFDTLLFEERYTNLNYTNVYQRLPNGRSMGGEFFFERRSADGRNKGKISQKWFQIPNYYQTISINYPELRAFSGMYWIYQGNLNKRQFKKKFLKKKWSDIRIEFDKNNSMFTIQVKSATGFEKFNAYPLISKTAPLEKTQETYVRKFLIYQKALSRKAEQFKKNQNREKKRYNDNFIKMLNYSWKELQLKMSNEEKLMNREDWLEYYDNIVANEKKAIDNTSLSLGYLIRQLTLMGFNSTGNNIQTSNGYRVTPLNIDFIDAKGAGKLAVTNIITVDSKNKSFSQRNGTLGLSPNLLFLSQFSSNLIFVELRNGNFGLVTSNEIDRLPLQPNQTSQFKVKIFDKNLDTIGNLLKDAGLE